MDENGIVYFLGTNWKTDEWKNPALERGVIQVSSSRLAKDSAPAWSVTDVNPSITVKVQETSKFFSVFRKTKFNSVGI